MNQINIREYTQTCKLQAAQFALKNTQKIKVFKDFLLFQIEKLIGFVLLYLQSCHPFGVQRICFILYPQSCHPFGVEWIDFIVISYMNLCALCGSKKSDTKNPQFLNNKPHKTHKNTKAKNLYELMCLMWFKKSDI